jgi:hypothetical protein
LSFSFGHCASVGCVVFLGSVFMVLYLIRINYDFTKIFLPGQITCSHRLRDNRLWMKAALTTQPTLDYIALNFKRGKQYQYVTTLHKLQSSKWSPNSRNEYLLSQGDFFCVYRNIPSYACDYFTKIFLPGQITCSHRLRDNRLWMKAAL